MSARKISDLPNLGPASERMLKDVGIETVGELVEIGSVEAYCRVRFQLGKRGASLNLLYAIEAALLNRDWRDLSPAEKEGLKAKID